MLSPIVTPVLGLVVCFLASGLSLISPLAAGAEGADELAAYRAAVQADWALQEARQGRKAGSVEAIRVAALRGERLLAALSSVSGVGDLSAQARQLEALKARVAEADKLDQAARMDLYHRLRWFNRNLALMNPLVTGQPIIFLKRQRFICQMLHEYLGYYYGPDAPLMDVPPGGGVCILEQPGRSTAVRDLTAGRLPPGSFTTLALSFDARTAYFAYCRREAKKPDYYRPTPGRRYFHLYSISTDGQRLRQLTNDPYDDFDPCPLPDGGLAFMSARRGGFGRCNNPWEPLPTYTLHRMDADGRNIRTLSLHETNQWHPQVLNDGRIVYCRWDYVDRSAANFHGLWASNPDGTNPVILFGNYTMRINACYQPRPIPGSRKIAFIAGAHHAAVGGALVILDPSRAQLDPRSGEDSYRSIEVLTPWICFPEGVGWPDCYFHSPWPLSEDFFLVSYSNEPLPGMSAKARQQTHTGIYYFDRFGNLELLYREDGISCMYPIPLRPRPVPPVIPSTLYADLRDEGEFVLTDVARSLFPLPPERKITHLRIFQLLPKPNHVVNEPWIGHANAENARMLLGTVPVESDGSAYFRAPARKLLYFQAVDASGRAVQSMRSATYLQPGERRGCVGCHEPPTTAAPARQLMAMKRRPSLIEPGPDGTRPMSYPRLVQPVLDRYCVSCHDGTQGPGKGKTDLSGTIDPPFTRSYKNLKPYLNWYAWGHGHHITFPGTLGADTSRLTAILTDKNHVGVKLDDQSLRKLYLWMDANVPFYGTYWPQEQAAQLKGEAVDPPALQ